MFVNLLSPILDLFSIYIELLNITGIQRWHKEPGRFGSIHIWGKLFRVFYIIILASIWTIFILMIHFSQKENVGNNLYFFCFLVFIYLLFRVSHTWFAAQEQQHFLQGVGVMIIHQKGLVRIMLCIYCSIWCHN